MPAKRRQAKRTLTIELQEDMAQRLEELLVQTRRSASAEVALAVEFWLERQGMGESAVEPESKPSRRPSPS
jgi:predicted transcriptional regulator